MLITSLYIVTRATVSYGQRPYTWLDMNLDHQTSTERSSRSWVELCRQMLERDAQRARDQVGVRRAQALITAVDRWADPRLEYRYAPRPIQTRLGPLGHSLSLSQQLPWPGEVDATSSLAKVKMRQARSRVRHTSVNLVYALEAGLWRLWALKASRSVLTRQLDITQALIAHTKALAETDQIGLSEVQRAQLELLLRAEKITQHHAREPELRAQLGELLSLKGPLLDDPPLDLINGTLKLARDSAALSEHLQRDETQARQGMSYPELELAQLSVDVASIEHQRVVLAQKPRLKVGVQWSVINEITQSSALQDDVFSVQISSSLPIWRHADQRARAASRLQITHQVHELKEREAQWRLALETLKIHLLEHARHAQALDTQIIPNAAALSRSRARDHEVGRASILEVYRAKIKLAEFEHELIHTYRDFALSYARWRSLTQTQEGANLDLKKSQEESVTSLGLTTTHREERSDHVR